jgi:hypothetical protein
MNPQDESIYVEVLSWVSYASRKLGLHSFDEKTAIPKRVGPIHRDLQLQDEYRRLASGAELVITYDYFYETITSTVKRERRTDALRSVASWSEMMLVRR